MFLLDLIFAFLPFRIGLWVIAVIFIILGGYAYYSESEDLAIKFFIIGVSLAILSLIITLIYPKRKKEIK